MDIVAHALWATAAATAVNRTPAPRLGVAWFAAWAAFPDVFAFAPDVVAGIWYRVSGAGGRHTHLHHLPGFDLYELSHSLVIFVAVFVMAWLLLKRPVWPLLGWALHIAMDIPSHSAHFPTPFLWPLSAYMVSGVSWRQWSFTAVNYALLALAFLLLWLSSARRRPGRC